MTDQVTAQNPATNNSPLPLTAENRPILDQVIEKVKGMSLATLIIAGAASVAAIAAMSMWATSAEYQVMYSDLSDTDGGKIIDELQKRGIEYRFSNNGHTLLVPADQVHALRLQLAEAGLPQGGNVGYELLDQQGFGISQFAEHVNFQRGLEGELSRTIESLGPVTKSRVHLVMPKESVFVRERQPASASVVVQLQNGRSLAENQIDAITYLVSSSVSNLPADKVTIVDQAGRLLSKPGRASGELDETQLKYTGEIEAGYQRRIEAILSPILGSRNVKAQVVAQVDFSAREQTAERYSPNQPPNEQAVRSQQTTEDYSGNANGARGVPGALTNSPPNSPAVTTPDGQANPTYANTDSLDSVVGTQASMRRDKMINYEVDRTVEHVKARRGSVTRLSAAVVVNYKMTESEDGESKPVPLSDEEIDQVRRLVRQAIGFSEQRGDNIEVINSQFTESKTIFDEEPWWKSPEFYSLATSIGRYLLIGIIILILWLTIIRPTMRKHEAKIEAQKEREIRLQSLELVGNGYQVGPNGEILDGASDGESDEPVKRKKPVYQQNLNGFRQMSKDDPKIVAGVIKLMIKKK